MTQHKVVIGPNEVARQGRYCHVATACDFVSLHLDGKRAPRRGVVQIYNERRLSGCAARAQGPSRDQVRLG